MVFVFPLSQLSGKMSNSFLCSKSKRMNKRLGRTRFTDENVKQARKFLQDGTGVKPRFLSRFEGFRVKNGQLFFENREVVQPSRREEVVRKLFDDESKPKGFNKLESYVTAHFVGIPNSVVRKVIKSQSSHQMKRRVLKPQKARSFIVQTKPFHELETDCMFISEKWKAQNGNSNIILNVVDRHTGYFWSTMIQRQTAEQVKPFLARIFAQVKKWGFGVKRLISDNGNEYSNHVIAALCNEWGVSQQFTKPYQPSYTIESANGHMRRAFNQFMEKYNTRRIRDWIPKYVQRVNNSVKAITKMTPEQMRQLGAEERFKVNQRVFARKKAGIKPHNLLPITVGQKVRISLVQRDKDNKIGHIDTEKPNWSDRLYEVERITRSRGQPRFFLKGLKRFLYRTELQLVTSYDPTSRKSYKDRPVLSDAFDPERHIKNLAKQKPKQTGVPDTMPTQRVLRGRVVKNRTSCEEDSETQSCQETASDSHRTV